MLELTIAYFSERPPYDPGMADILFAEYCTVSSVKTTTASTPAEGIDVTKRKDAIRKSLAKPSESVRIFGELELDVIKDR